MQRGAFLVDRIVGVDVARQRLAEDEGQEDRVDDAGLQEDRRADLEMAAAQLDPDQPEGGVARCPRDERARQDDQDDLENRSSYATPLPARA